MKTLAACAGVVLITGVIVSSQLAPLAGVEEAPPVVIKTFPEAGKINIDPAVSEVRVTFSKKMMDQSWSWSTATDIGEALPITDKPKYSADGRTCTAAVKLEPGKTYATWLNSANFGNFKDADGRSAVPYLLVFKTKDR
jgi:hypothetical protein